MTSIALKELRSYKQLPQIWYQIAPKFRDEPRPRSGLLRVRQFMMKDAYSFDIDAAGLDVSYKKHYETYCRIFDRCGLKYMVVEADSGAMGGKESHEFMVRTPAGEDQIVSCDGMQLRGEHGEGDFEAGAVGRSCAGGRWEAAGGAHAGAEDDRRSCEVPGSVAEEQDQDAGATWPTRPTSRKKKFAGDRGADAGQPSNERSQVQRDMVARDAADGRGGDQGAVQVSGGIFGADGN